MISQNVKGRAFIRCSWDTVLFPATYQRIWPPASSPPSSAQALQPSRKTSNSTSHPHDEENEHNQSFQGPQSIQAQSNNKNHVQADNSSGRSLSPTHPHPSQRIRRPPIRPPDTPVQQHTRSTREGGHQGGRGPPYDSPRMPYPRSSQSQHSPSRIDPRFTNETFSSPTIDNSQNVNNTNKNVVMNEILSNYFSNNRPSLTDSFQKNVDSREGASRIGNGSGRYDEPQNRSLVPSHPAIPGYQQHPIQKQQSLNPESTLSTNPQRQQPGYSTGGNSIEALYRTFLPSSSPSTARHQSFREQNEHKHQTQDQPTVAPLASSQQHQPGASMMPSWRMRTDPLKSQQMHSEPNYRQPTETQQQQLSANAMWRKRQQQHNPESNNQASQYQTQQPLRPFVPSTKTGKPWAPTAPGTQPQYQNFQQQQTTQQQQPQAHPGQQPTIQEPTASPPMTAGSNAAESVFSSPLTEFIRRLQEQHAKKKEAESNNAKAQLGPTPLPPLPEWRRTPSRLRSGSDIGNNTMGTGNSLRDMRQQEYERRVMQREHEQATIENFLRPDRPSKKSNVKSNDGSIKGQVITLPAYPLNVMEASLLLREKTTVIRRILQSIGELPPSRRNEPDETIQIEVDTLELISLDLGLNVERSKRRAMQPSDDEILLHRRAASETANSEYVELPRRPPVVTIMGHVDHGKTTLMDALRRRAAQHSSKSVDTKKKSKKEKSSKAGGGTANGENVKNVAGTEAGGITQVISAFEVPLLGHELGTVTFLDTPGHAAFRAMRQSGSDAADIIVLVVAADDGVSPQTVEILNFYKSIVRGSGGGGISMVVAMNKVDKPSINVEESRQRITAQLYGHGILTEEMAASADGTEVGPPVQLIPVSGLTGKGLDDLIEGLVLQSEVMDLRSDADARAEGIVLDARVDKGLGIVADCVIRWGSIERGHVVVSGTSTGKVRVLRDVHDKMIKRGGPSQPIRIIGFDSLPKAGEPFICMESEQAANDLVERRKALTSDESGQLVVAGELELQSAGKHLMKEAWRAALEKKYDLDLDKGDKKGPIRIPVVVKADADGTLAAVRDALVQLGEESVHDIAIEPFRMGVGPVLDTDIEMAKVCDATILCFNIKNDASITSQAEKEGVALLRSDIIYSLLDDAKIEFARYLPQIPVEIVHGKGKVRAVYEIGGIKNKVAGLVVTDGKMYRDRARSPSVSTNTLKCEFRIARKGQQVFMEKPLTATSLKHFKEDVDEVERGKECGLSLAGYDDFEEGDIIECFSIEMRKQTI